MIEAFNCGDRAIIGELVTKFAVLYREAVAIISNANREMQMISLNRIIRCGVKDLVRWAVLINTLNNR